MVRYCRGLGASVLGIVNGYRVVAIACAMGALLWAMGAEELVVPVMAADIRSTPHNLARKGSLVEADEVCVFCHTPQLSPGGVGSAPRPVWQAALPSTHDFLMFDDIGRAQYGKNAVGTQSVACLSCHDGGQAFAIMVGGSDHPFGIPYRGFLSQGKMGGPPKQVSGETEGHPVAPSKAAQSVQNREDFRPPSQGKIENRTIWWVSREGVSTVRTRADLPLYARYNGDEETPYIECSSCHDPHVVRPLFLRVSNQEGKLCLTCHDK